MRDVGWRPSRGHKPPSFDEIAHLHSTIALLIAHHQRWGYRHFVVDHIWRTTAELTDSRNRLLEVDAHSDIRCFLLTLPLDENLRRIKRRQSARAIDEEECELTTLEEERRALFERSGGELGEAFDVSGSPAELVTTMLKQLALMSCRNYLK